MGSFSVPGSLLTRPRNYGICVENFIPDILNTVKYLKTRITDPSTLEAVATDIIISDTFSNDMATLIADSITINGTITNSFGGIGANDSDHVRARYLFLTNWYGRRIFNFSISGSYYTHAYSGFDRNFIISNYHSITVKDILSARGFVTEVNTSSNYTQSSGGITLIIGNRIEITGTVTANSSVGGIILIFGRIIKVSGIINASAGGVGLVAILGESVFVTGDVTGGKARVIDTVKW